MAEPTLLTDRIQPAWQALTPEQRTCWHFWAQATPINADDGELRTLYGQQAHYRTNANLAIANTPALLTDPPPPDTPVQDYSITPILWPIKAKPATGPSTNAAFASIVLTRLAPANQLGIVTQGYYTKKIGKGRPPRIRHVTLIIEGSFGVIELRVPEGYYALTAGVNRFSKIKGQRAVARPDRPLGMIKIVNALTGSYRRQAIRNPMGGGRTMINRPRATAFRPKAGNHFP